MSDVAAVENLVKKHQELKKEIAKVIVGQETVIDQILLSIYTGGHSPFNRSARFGKDFNGKYHCADLGVGF